MIIKQRCNYLLLQVVCCYSSLKQIMMSVALPHPVIYLLQYSLRHPNNALFHHRVCHSLAPFYEANNLASEAILITRAGLQSYMLVKPTLLSWQQTNTIHGVFYVFQNSTFSMFLVAFTDIYPPMLSFKGVLAWVTVNFLTGETWGRRLGKDI